VSAERSLLGRAGVRDETAVVSQVSGSVFGQRLVDESGDVELDALPHWKPLAENC